MRRAFSDSESERAAPGDARAGVVGSPKRCPVCGAPMLGRKTSACSDRCRAAKSRGRRVPLPIAEAKAIRASLATALEAVSDAKTTLERYGNR